MLQQLTQKRNNTLYAFEHVDDSQISFTLTKFTFAEWKIFKVKREYDGGFT